MISLGILDFDSSHCVEFTRRLNHVGVTSDQFVEGARVVAGCPGASAMAPERTVRFLPEVAACGVAIVDRDEVLRQADAILVLSLCGGGHREPALESIANGRPTFVDKPFALTVADAEAIVAAAERADVPLHYASAMRYCDELLTLPHHLARWGKVNGAVCYGPAKRHPFNPGLFHYGIHTVEILFTLLGAGCVSVASTHSENGEVVTGRWSDGRLGTVRGLRSGCTAYGATLFCEHGVIPLALSAANSYRNLLQALVAGLKSGSPLVPSRVILEETAFVLAALESERRGGIPVDLATILID